MRQRAKQTAAATGEAATRRAGAGSGSGASAGAGAGASAGTVGAAAADLHPPRAVRPPRAPGEAAPPRPPKDVRDEIRRAQIVEAARQCVIRRGFHAAPMSEIAKEAHMSVGQIYRYFANKDAIVRAIVEDIIARRLHRMTTNPSVPYTPERLATRSANLDARHAEDSLLMLEVTAEATRDPEIAAVLVDADRRSQQEALKKTMREHPWLTRKQAAARCELIAVLIEGTMFRRVTELQAEKKEMVALYQSVMECVFGVGAGGVLRR